MAQLFSALDLRSITLRNRIVVSPMCQYSSIDGFADDWHLVHLGSRAVGGAGLIFTEAIAVEARGRISPQDLGIWRDEHIEMLARITHFIKAQGAHVGTQIAHAGRKASTKRPWDGDGYITPDEGGWQPIAPSALAFSTTYGVPQALSLAEIPDCIMAFARAAERSLLAGFDVLEIHAAHGYLLHQFLSPLANQRTDAYGGNFENRTRLVREVVAAVRKVWPEHLPLFVRISASDWVPGGWNIDESVQLARQLKQLGVDVIDTSSGGLVPDAKIPVAPLYQVPFAQRIRHEAQIATGAVGMITTAEEAETIIREHQADLVFLAREELRSPYWPLKAASALDVNMPWPQQYQRGKPSKHIYSG